MYSAALAPQVSKNDLVMGFSGSGNSKNIVEAFKFAKSKGAKTISISRDGGKSHEIADLSIIIPGSSNFPGQTGSNDNNFHFEDEVLSINSIIVGLLKLKIQMNSTELNQKINLLKFFICKMCFIAKSGHPMSSLSCADIIGILYFDIMNHGIDKFMLSKGHAAQVCTQL